MEDLSSSLENLWNDPFSALSPAEDLPLQRIVDRGTFDSHRTQSSDAGRRHHSAATTPSDYRHSTRDMMMKRQVAIPHRGSLIRVDASSSSTALSYQYMIEIRVENSGRTHALLFERQDFDFISRLFSILDTESCGSVAKEALHEFVTLRCPVFWRRDEDLRKVNKSANLDENLSPTFEEVWKAVVECSSQPYPSTKQHTVELGVEGWMVFCRFIALAQYLEAKRRFSARHLQQTMRHRNSPRGSEVVVVDVPPPAPPVSLTPTRLADYEQKGKAPLPLPELDLDHTLIAAHDRVLRKHRAAAAAAVSTVHQVDNRGRPKVKISLFGSKTNQPMLLPSSTNKLEFAVTYFAEASHEEVVVRRSFSDMKWLNDTIKSHTGIGGTLCGRILPPFPESTTVSTLSHFQPDEKTIQTAIEGTGAAMKAAATGVGMIKSAAKSFWGSYVKKPSKKLSKAKERTGSTNQSTSKAKKATSCISESYYNPNSPDGKARQLERYLNYLLEHPALSASFPLNTILKASQSGLEAAKIFLADHAKSTTLLKAQTPQLSEGKSSVPFWLQQQKYSNYDQQPNLSWVRTAAQAAMALHVHGLLETSGLPSASARLQHASLPNFDKNRSGWGDEENSGGGANSDSSGESVDEIESFEQGVIQVESELMGVNNFESGANGEDEGYDLLPLPVPAPERRILCAGSTAAPAPQPTETGFFGMPSRRVAPAQRFRYGGNDNDRELANGDQFEVESAFLGDFPVDENIDKLREVIGSVDNTLSRCLGAAAAIGEARRELLGHHLDIVRGFDSWEGLRGKFISQRALMKGVDGLEQSKDACEEGDLDLIDDISWQASLASAAVAAAEDVRSTVRASRTATNAKAAADSAAFAAQSACQEKFASIDEARAAQTRASIAHSHAIHAAVVEHEANTAKRRAALGLAHDVKCWNVQRKREVLKSCIAFARSQHVATRRAVDSWSCLRDGYLGPSIVPCEARISKSSSHHSILDMSAGLGEAFLERQPPTTPIVENEDKEEAHAEVYSEITPDMQSALEAPTIEAVDHMLLATHLESVAEEEPTAVIHSVPSADEGESEKSQMTKSQQLKIVDETPTMVLPLVDASPIVPPFAVSPIDVQQPDENDGQDESALSSSMQSLVDGLMSWGGQYDPEQDFSLPTGMAQSIVLEENGMH